MAVAVIDELREDDLELGWSEDQHPIETLTSDRANEPLGEGVSCRTPNSQSGR